MFLIIGSILGLLLIVGVTVIAIRLLRQSTHQYQGVVMPQHRPEPPSMMGPR
jgi:hypothetical protein